MGGGEGEEERERASELLSSSSLPQWLKQPGRGKVEPGPWNSMQACAWGQGPRFLSPPCCRPGCVLAGGWIRSGAEAGNGRSARLLGPRSRTLCAQPAPGAGRCGEDAGSVSPPPGARPPLQAFPWAVRAHRSDKHSVSSTSGRVQEGKPRACSRPLIGLCCASFV